MDGLVKDRGIVGDVDKHGDLALPEGLPLSSTNEVVLKEPSELALPERHHSLFTAPVIVHGVSVCVWGEGGEISYHVYVHVSTLPQPYRSSLVLCKFTPCLPKINETFTHTYLLL